MSRKHKESNYTLDAYSTSEDEHDSGVEAHRAARKRKRKSFATYGVFGGSGSSSESEQYQHRGSLNAGAKPNRKHSSISLSSTQPTPYLYAINMNFVSGGREGGTNEQQNDEQKFHDEDDSNLSSLAQSTKHHSSHSSQEASFSNTDQDQDENEDFMLPVSFGAKRKTHPKQRQSQNDIYTAANAFANNVPDPPFTGEQQQDLGDWEKYTKGIGAKLLSKMGFKGRLGAKEQGIAAPVEVKVRPNRLGLAAGNFTERTEQQIKDSAVLDVSAQQLDKSNVNLKKQKQKARKISSKSKKNAWKKSFKSKTHKTLDELAAIQAKIDKQSQDQKNSDSDMSLVSPDKEPAKDIFIDMRGKNSRQVSSAKDLLEAPDDDSDSEYAEVVVTQELLHNLKLIIDLSQVEMQSCSKLADQERDRVQYLENEIQELNKKHEKNLQRLNNIHKLAALVEQLVSVKSIQDFISIADDICTNHSDELNAAADKFQLKQALLLSSVPLLSKELQMNRMHSVSAIALANKIRTLMGGIDSQDYIIFLSRSFLVSSRLYFGTRWTAKSEQESASEVEQFTAWKEIFPLPFWKVLQNEVICPRLSKEIDKCPEVRSWGALLCTSQKSDTNENSMSSEIDFATRVEPTIQNVHEWVIPWLPLLGKEAMKQFSKQIFKIISKSSKYWRCWDSDLISIMKIWRPPISSQKDFSGFFKKYIEPKLVGNFENAKLHHSQEAKNYQPLVFLFMWYDVVSDDDLMETLVPAFYLNWLEALRQWLLKSSDKKSAEPDFEHVSDWYKSWKDAFPDRLKRMSKIKMGFNVGLDLINLWMNGDDLRGADIINELLSHRLRSNREEQDKEKVLHKLSIKAGDNALQKTAETVSGIDVLERFSETHGLSLIPARGGRKTEDGYNIYVFNGKNVYYDSKKKIFFCQTAKSVAFCAIALDELIGNNRECPRS